MTISAIEQFLIFFFSSYLVIQFLRILLVIGLILYLKKRFNS